MNLDQKTIAVIGLGYVGLPLAVEFGKSRRVIGFDINEARLAQLRGGTDSTLEVPDDELAEAGRGIDADRVLVDLARCADGRMHLRFARGHEYLVGFPVQATCRGCGTLNNATAPAR